MQLPAIKPRSKRNGGWFYSLCCGHLNKTAAVRTYTHRPTFAHNCFL